MTRIIKSIITILLLIIYIYSIAFTFLPITGKMLLALCGVIICILKCRNSSTIQLKRKYIALFYPLLILFIWGGITMLINGSNEAIYVYNLIIPIVSLFASFAVAYLCKDILFKDDITLYKYIGLAVLVESLLTVLIKISPSVYTVVSSIQYFLTHEEVGADIEDYYRLVGIGEAVYFGVLPSCALGLLSYSYLLVKSQTKIELFQYFFSYIFIAVISFLVTRFSLVMLLVSMMYMIYMLRNDSRKIFYLLTLFVSSIVVLLNICMLILPENMYEWALEMVINKENTGTFSSSTTDTMVDWWTNVSMDMKTFLVGDARYLLEGGGYYKHIDIGIIRQILYGGVIGLILNFISNYVVLKYTYKTHPTKEIKFLMIAFFFSYLAALTKGDLNMMDLFVFQLVMLTFLNSRSSLGYRN